KGKTFKFDKAFGVALTLGPRALLESYQVLIVERIFAFAANNGGIALVELERHPAGDKFLALVDRRLQHFPLGGKPEAVIDKFRIFRHQLVFEMCGTTIERDRFDSTVGREQYRAAGGLVHTA